MSIRWLWPVFLPMFFFAFEALSQPTLPGIPGHASHVRTFVFGELPGRSDADDVPRIVPAPQPTPADFRSHAPRRLSQKSLVAPKAFIATPSPGWSRSFEAAADTNWIPPDSHGAAGPTHVMTVVNGGVTVRTKHGELRRSTTLDAFWGTTLPANAYAFDPRAAYDPIQQVWFVVAVTLPRSTQSAVLVAMSLTPDPMGQWISFRVTADFSGATWADFPNLGFSRDRLVVTANMFPDTGIPGGQFHSNIWAFDRTGGANTITSYIGYVDNSAQGTLVPATHFDASNTVYLVQEQGVIGNTNRLRIGAIRHFGSINVTYTPTLWDIDTGMAYNGAFGNLLPQFGTTARLETIGHRMRTAVFRNGALWASQTAQPSGAQRWGAQWWRLDPSNGQIVDRGIIDDPTGNLHYDYPSLAVNKRGDALIGFTRFSAGTYPSAGYAYRHSSDPPSTFRLPQIYRQGAWFFDRDAGSGRYRWGDYSNTVGDPNGIDFWTVQEYAETPTTQTRWGTWWSMVRPPLATRLSSVSTRAMVLTGNEVLIGGFVLNVQKKVMVRARGPSLTAFGINNALANPVVDLRRADGTPIAFNDNWGSAGNASEIADSGLAPANPLESAILVTLPAGAYTPIVSGAGGGTGVGIVEVYEADHPDVPIANLSSRGWVGTGSVNDLMIAGFGIEGDVPMTVVVRVRGPSLAPFGIGNALANPRLELYRSSDMANIASNDNWRSASNAAQIEASGFAPSNDLESAILITLNPGNYTAIVSGVNFSSGVAIVEVFPLP